ncbi:MAG: hypothetical protein DME25_03975, partial [Verrucomicrobia bacterium]
MPRVRDPAVINSGCAWRRSWLERSSSPVTVLDSSTAFITVARCILSWHLASRRLSATSHRWSLALYRARGKLVFMALAENLARLSETEYLRIERQAETRSEYFEGEMFAMAGGTRAQSLIATNLLRELSAALED